MSNFTHNEETIFRYLDGELNETEQQEFERLLQSDKNLQTEWQGLAVAKEAVKQYGLKAKVASLHTEMMEELKEEKLAPVKKMSSFRRIIRYSVAAAASVIIIFLGIQAWNFYQLSPDKLYNENYVAYDMTTRAGESTSSATEKLFAEKKYTELIDRVKSNSQLISSTSVSPKDVFLSGLAALELKRNADAVTLFKQVLETEKAPGTRSGLGDDAEYYLALAYLRNKDYDQAIDLMNQIRSTNGHTYQKQFSSSFVRRVKMLKWR